MLEHIWAAFQDLTRSRQAGMAANPITYAEIGAYDRETFAGLSAWAKGLIRRIDDAVLWAVADDREKRAPQKANSVDDEKLIPASDVKGLKGMFRSMAARQTGTR